MKPEKSQERDMKLGRRKKLKKQFPCPLTKKIQKATDRERSGYTKLRSHPTRNLIQIKI